MNTTANGSSLWSCSSPINPEALKAGTTVAYSFILVVSLVGNSLIVLIVYKTPTLRKPINMLIANMAMSDLLYPIFLFPVRLAELNVGRWLIGGILGQALFFPKFFPRPQALGGVTVIQALRQGEERRGGAVSKNKKFLLFGPPFGLKIGGRGWIRHCSDRSDSLKKRPIQSTLPKTFTFGTSTMCAS